MRKIIASLGLLMLSTFGCSTTTPMAGGLADDHEAVVADCGVGNYRFRYLKEPCATKDESVASSELAIPAPPAEEMSTSMSSAERPVDVSDSITFEEGSSTITSNGMAVLDHIAEVVNMNPSGVSKINIEGYTDYTGSAAHNFALSEARADAVRVYLMDKGIDTQKMSVKAYGETRAKYGKGAPNAALKSERRVQLEIVPTQVVE